MERVIQMGEPEGAKILRWAKTWPIQTKIVNKKKDKEQNDIRQDWRENTQLGDGIAAGNTCECSDIFLPKCVRE